MKLFALALLLAGCGAQLAVGPGGVIGGATPRPLNLACFDGDAAHGCQGWRSGQPTETQVQALGVKSVLKLNSAIEGKDHLPAGVEPLEHPWLFVGPVDH